MGITWPIVIYAAVTAAIAGASAVAGAVAGAAIVKSIYDSDADTEFEIRIPGLAGEEIPELPGMRHEPEQWEN